MVVDNKHRSNLFINDQDDPQSSSENGPDSPYSDDESKTTTITTTTTNKRRSIKKKVVTVSMGDNVNGSRSKGEAYPPSDSWAWRKYGQKPIKGSPYPRGYYRCSSSKGCPARKQVERSRVDPTKVVITYACEHNHPLPASKHHNNHQPTTTTANAAAAASNATTTSSSEGPTDSADVDEPSSSSPSIQINNPLGGQSPQLEYVGDTLVLGNLGVDVEYSWISDVSFYTPSFVGPTCDDVEVVAFTMKEEDESLFGDLDELPEYSMVFPRNMETCSTISTPIYYNTR